MKNVKIQGVDYTGVSEVHLPLSDGSGNYAKFQDVGGSLDIGTNGIYDVTRYEQASVNVLAGGAIGEYSKYQLMNNVRPTQTYFTFSHSLGVVPKLVVISCATVSPAYLNNGYIRTAILSNVIGAVRGANLASGLEVAAGYNIDAAMSEAGGASNATYNLRANSCTIMPQGGNMTWNTATDYTIKLYA